MKFTEEQLSLIKEYIMDELTQDRKALFDENMKSVDFRNEVIQELSIFSAIQESANSTLKETIKSFDDGSELSKGKNAPIQNPSFNGENKILKYLLGLLLISVLSILMFYTFKSQNNVNQVYAEMYETYPATEIKRGKTNQEDSKLTNAMTLYRQGSYEKAINEFETIEPTDPSIELYKAVSFIELEQYPQAQTKLKEVIASSDVELKQVAEWYNLLLLYKMKNIEEFDSALEGVLNNESHLFNSKAKELKSKL